MPSYAAGPRPATVRLAQTSSQCIKETLNRYLPLPSSATRPANSVAPKPQIIARNRVRPRRSHKPSRSNLHSAPQPPASLTAVSFPGGFRTPAPVQAASSRVGRHPKPFTIATGRGKLQRPASVRNAPLATVGPKKAACRDGPMSDIAASYSIISSARPATSVGSSVPVP